MHTPAILAAAYAAVLLAEVAGDRSIYTIASLTARFRPLPVLLGIAPAYALKMAAAVVIADRVAHLGPSFLAAVSCATWLITAWAVWRREEAGTGAASARLRNPSVVAFAAVALTEWGDPGQLTAALLAANLRAPLAVWSGATLALMTKAAVAATLGLTARRYLAVNWLRTGAAAFCVVNAAIAVTAMVLR